jgi:L,D-peptidoglycan transpeptidase YkuD (ErfK/YbiS/YcfS/YnhG family)
MFGHTPPARSPGSAWAEDKVSGPSQAPLIILRSDAPAGATRLAGQRIALDIAFGLSASLVILVCLDLMEGMTRAAGTILLTCAVATTALAQQSRLPASCRQCIVVGTDSWSASRGTLTAFDRDRKSAWREHDLATPVLIGKAGLAWGRGVVDVKDLAGPIKIEGDDKAPAGVFRLASVFGRASHAGLTKMPYLPLSTSIVAVNDPRSRYYNQLVDVTKIQHRDWRTAENMILKDHRYDWGVFVNHNLPPRRRWVLHFSSRLEGQLNIDDRMHGDAAGKTARVDSMA